MDKVGKDLTSQGELDPTRCIVQLDPDFGGYNTPCGYGTGSNIPEGSRFLRRPYSANSQKLPKII